MFGRLHGMEKLNPHIWGATAYRGDFTPIFGGLRPMGAVSPYKEHFALWGSSALPPVGISPRVWGGCGPPRGAFTLRGGFHPRLWGCR